MRKVTDPSDLFRYKLGVMLATEKGIEGMLPRMQKEANDGELASGLERHLEQTRGHIANLEQIFELMGEKPERVPSPALEGLETEYKGFAANAADDVWPDVLDMVAAGAAAATEHHEIAGYEALVTMAKALRVEQALSLLQENLEQDRAMLQGAEQVAQRLAQRVEREGSTAAA